jgi:hypothetical protein
MNQKPNDIIENLDMVVPPVPHAWLVPTLIGLGVLLAAGLAVWRLYRKKKLPFQEAPPIPPDAIALKELEKIRPLLEGDDYRGLVIEVSRILRYYIEGRFGLKAPRLSTEEFLYLAEDSEHLNAAHKAGLAEFLKQCDRVKFALGGMERPGMSGLYEAAKAFVLQTRQPPPQPGKAGKA